ncbi:MAG: iron chelate uptake ABC transporter family permease subunit [Micrococcaceae bacterium]
MKKTEVTRLGIMTVVILVLLLIEIFFNDGGTSAFILKLFTFPRIVLACLLGVVYALSGFLFQLTFKNPLASPDIVGINAGASAGALVTFMIVGVAGVYLSIGAVIGAATVCAIALYYAKPMRSATFALRLVLIGIALATLSTSVVAYIISILPINEAQQSMQWLSGSLNSASWDTNILLLVILLLCIGALAYLNKTLGVLELAEYSAQSLGVNPIKYRGIVLGIAVILAASATAVTGPVMFVAFLSPQLARILVPEAKFRLLRTALTGVLFMLAADVIAQHIVPGQKFPVGAITGVLGAVYLLWFLVQQRQKLTVEESTK